MTHVTSSLVCLCIYLSDICFKENVIGCLFIFANATIANSNLKIKLRSIYLIWNEFSTLNQGSEKSLYLQT